jgi:hypothetical protein
MTRGTGFLVRFDTFITQNIGTFHTPASTQRIFSIFFTGITRNRLQIVTTHGNGGEEFVLGEYFGPVFK